MATKCNRCLRRIPDGQRFCSACMLEMGKQQQDINRRCAPSLRSYGGAASARPSPSQPAPRPAAPRRKKHSREAFGKWALMALSCLLLVMVVAGTLRLLKRHLDAAPGASPSEAPVLQGPLSPETPSEPSQPLQPPAPSEPSRKEPAEPALTVWQQAEQEIPYFSQRCFLQQLTEEELADFLTLYRCILRFEKTCYLSDSADTERVQRLFFLQHYECPELFQVDPEISHTRWSSEGKLSYVEIHYAMTPEDYASRLAQCQARVQEITAGTEGLSQWEKELYAYEYLVSHCQYDKDADDAFSAYGSLVKGIAKCDGISQGMKWLLEEMGMRCLVLAGGRPEDGPGHAWNCVSVDGQFADADVTADVPTLGEEKVTLYGGLQIPRSWMTDRYPLWEGVQWAELPGTESLEYSWHSRNGSLLSGTDWDPLLDELAAQVQQTGTGEIRMQFTTRDAFDAATSLGDAALQRLVQTPGTYRIHQTFQESFLVRYLQAERLTE